MARTMEHVILLGLLLLSGMRPVSVVDPAYPPNVLAGGTGIATLSVKKGSVEGGTIVFGDEPFAGAVMAGLKGWRFSPEVGRASCGGRGESSVGAGSLKKKI